MTALLLGVRRSCLEDGSGCCRRWCIQVWFNQLYAPRPCSAEASGRVHASSGGARNNAEASAEDDGVWLSLHRSGSAGSSLGIWMLRSGVLMLRIFSMNISGSTYGSGPQALDCRPGVIWYQAVQKERRAYKLTFLCFVYYLKLNHVLVWKLSLFSSLHLSTAHCWRPFIRLIFRKHQSLELYYSSWTLEVKTTTFGLFGSWCPTYSLCEDGTVVLL